MHYTTGLVAGLVALSTAAPLVERQSCPPLELLFARGTGEISKLGIMGAPLGSGIAKGVPGTVSTGVDYPATDFTASPAAGAEWVVNYIKTKSAACPSTLYAIGGYSQGAMVVHRVAPLLGAELTKKVVASAVFGDPNRQWGAFMGGSTFPVPDQKADVIAFCGTSDAVCGSDKAGPQGGHTSYGSNGSVAKAAEFVIARYNAKKGGAAAPAPGEEVPETEAPMTPAPAPTPAPTTRWPSLGSWKFW